MSANKNNVFTILTLLCTLILVTSSHCKCNSFHNVEIRAVPKSANLKAFNKTITGCIERQAFETVVKEVFIKNQNIPSLGTDSIRHMVSLISVSFDSCEINSIEPGAFRNVPRLQMLKIVKTNIAKIPSDLFQSVPSLLDLELELNKISLVENGAFANMENILKISLSKNNLKEWNPDWFSNNTRLETIVFKFNKLKTIPRLAFVNIPRIKNVHLEFNEISTIQKDAFGDIKYLKVLELNFNHLKQLQSQIFSTPTAIKIETLLLGGNYLNYIADKLLKRLLVKEIVLDGNPIKCSCYEALTTWILGINGSFKAYDECGNVNVPICVQDEINLRLDARNSCVETVDENITKTFTKGLLGFKHKLNKYCVHLE